MSRRWLVAALAAMALLVPAVLTAVATKTSGGGPAGPARVGGDGGVSYPRHGPEEVGGGGYEDERRGPGGADPAWSRRGVLVPRPGLERVRRGRAERGAGGLREPRVPE